MYAFRTYLSLKGERLIATPRQGSILLPKEFSDRKRKSEPFTSAVQAEESENEPEHNKTTRQGNIRIPESKIENGYF